MNKNELELLGYKIENAIIKEINISMADHGCLTLSMPIEGSGWSCVYGGVCLGKGYLGATEFKGFGKGTEYLMRIMDVVGVSNFRSLEGKYIRVATKGSGCIIKIIGNIVEDKWFNPDELFAKNEDLVDCKDDK